MPAAIAIPLITAGITAGGTYAASRSAAGANRNATRSQERTTNAALDYERQRDEEARRQWAAEQAFQQQQFAAQEEERAFARQRAEYQDQLLREREARQAPYRQAAQGAVTRLSDLLGIQVVAPPAVTAPRQSAGPSDPSRPWFSPAGPLAGKSPWGPLAGQGRGPFIGPPPQSVPVLTSSALPVSKKRSYAALLGRA